VTVSKYAKEWAEYFWRFLPQDAHARQDTTAHAQSKYKMTVLFFIAVPLFEK
jgi:hypothetical protein